MEPEAPVRGFAEASGVIIGQRLSVRAAVAVTCHPVSCERSLCAGPARALRHLPRHPPPHCAQAHLRLNWPWEGHQGVWAKPCRLGHLEIPSAAWLP